MSGNLPLTKCLDPADFDQLAEELVIVDRYFTSAREQHPMRRWEYAMALRALAIWHRGESVGSITDLEIYDVGGGGSPFQAIVQAALHRDDLDAVLVIDPAAEEAEAYVMPLSQALRQHPSLGDAVFCLSVLEHVDDLDQFLYHLSCLVAPGGLLFLTMDSCDTYTSSWSWPVDMAHFHWMRKRIFSIERWKDLAGDHGGIEEPLIDAFDREFDLLGEADWTYHGHQLFGTYSFASLALVKRP